MPPLTSLAPTTAERIRSACARAGGALLVVEREDPVPVPIHHCCTTGPSPWRFRSIVARCPVRKRCWS